jgi:glycosyltransferase 2 family protein
MKLKSILQYIAFLGLAIFMLWFVNKDLDKQAISNCLQGARKDMIVYIALVGVASIVFRALRWQLLIEPLGKTPRFINTFFSIFIGYGVNFFTPRLGEVARCGILSKYEGIGADKLAGTMIAERIVDLLCLLLMIMTTLLLEYNVVMDFFLTLIKTNFGENGLRYFGIGLVVITIVSIVGIRFMLRAKADSALGKLMRNLAEGITSVFKMKNRMQFVLYTFLIWFCYWGMTYLGFLGLSQLQHLNFGAGFSVLTFGSLGFLFPFGGAGAYQGVVATVLNSLYSIDIAPAKIYGLLSWALQNGILLIGAFVAMLAFPMVNKSKLD